MDSSSSQVWTQPSKGTRASITIGEVNGIIEPQKASWLSGFWKA